jgi:branched-chain amino acid transport system substrate-binding protein
MQNGFELARAEINNSGMLGGAAITFITEDDQSESSVEAFNKLIHQDGVSAITGLAISAQAIHAFPIAQENGVVAFSSVSSASGLSAIGDFIFRAGLTVDILNPSGVRITQEKLGYTKAATMYDESDLYSTSSHEGFRAALAENGVEIVSTETFQSGDTDFSAQLTRIMELNPDVLFISALGSHIPQIMIQARQLMPNVSFIVPELTSIEVEAAGDAAEGTVTSIGWLSTADTPLSQAFVNSYIRTYSAEPSAWAAQSHAAFHILAMAIAKAQSVNANAIRDALAKTTDLDTVVGKFSFDPNGEAVYDPIVLTVNNGQFEVFE